MYLATGGAIATVIAAVRRRLSPGDAAWLIGLWPLYAPLQLARGAPDPDPGLAHDLLAAIDRAQGSPLASVRPDVDSVRALGARLREASARRAELDDVLARPDFDPARAAARAREL
ncbi:MAG TPA: hypothetical protein VFP84_12780, partial [Kofleriaceae bacterium]|nr:hypothetical protein [Kofleriaceae bacterium]